MITTSSNNNSLFGLYDERFISQQSVFCENNQHNGPVSTSGTSSFEETNILDSEFANHSTAFNLLTGAFNLLTGFDQFTYGF